MKFHSETVFKPEEGGYITTKSFLCTNCYYHREVKEKHGDATVVEGDEEFILFPFSSLTKLDGTHVSLVACPKCQTVQFIDQVDNKEETNHVAH